MKICPNCGAENEDNVLKCMLCEFEFDTDVSSGSTSAPQTEETVKLPVMEKQELSSPKNISVSDSSGSGKGKIAIIALMAAVIFIGGVAGGILFMKNKGKSTEPPTSKSSQPTVTETTSVAVTTTETSTSTVSAVTSETTAAKAETTSSAATETVTAEAVKPAITAQLVETPALQGVTIYLQVSGDYSYYTYDSYEYGPDSSEDPYPTHGSSSSEEIRITAFSGGVTKVVVNVTPYNSNGVAGETVSAVYTRGTSAAKKVTSCNKFGNIYSPSGSKVDGLTRSYLIDGGAATYERHDLTDGWHISAVNYYYDGSEYWYELYDADDGDYYGWVNEKNISFY